MLRVAASYQIVEVFVLILAWPRAVCLQQHGADNFPEQVIIDWSRGESSLFEVTTMTDKQIMLSFLNTHNATSVEAVEVKNFVAISSSGADHYAEVKIAAMVAACVTPFFFLYIYYASRAIGESKSGHMIPSTLVSTSTSSQRV